MSDRGIILHKRYWAWCYRKWWALGTGLCLALRFYVLWVGFGMHWIVKHSGIPENEMCSMTFVGIGREVGDTSTHGLRQCEANIHRFSGVFSQLFPGFPLLTPCDCTNPVGCKFLRVLLRRCCKSKTSRGSSGSNRGKRNRVGRRDFGPKRKLFLISTDAAWPAKYLQHFLGGVQCFRILIFDFHDPSIKYFSALDYFEMAAISRDS